MKHRFELATGADGYSGTVIYAVGLAAVERRWRGRCRGRSRPATWRMVVPHPRTVRLFHGEAWSKSWSAWKVKIDLRLGSLGTVAVRSDWSGWGEPRERERELHERNPVDAGRGGQCRVEVFV